VLGKDFFEELGRTSSGSREIRLAKESTQSKSLEKRREEEGRKKNGGEREKEGTWMGRESASLLALI